MKKINHQFAKKDFYNPNWKIKHLFLGTFNPEEGEKVNYYYGRKRNQTWNILSEIFEEKLNTEDVNFLDKIKTHGIACLDLIDSVSVENNLIDYVNGKGYSDSKIINNKVIRIYNTEKINEIIKNNPSIKIYSSWGEGSKLKEWKNEISKIKNINKLVSPSMAARVEKGIEKFPYMLENWKKNIKK